MPHVAVRTYVTQLYNDGAMTKPYGAMVRALLERAGYVEDDAGAPGSYTWVRTDVDGRTGTSTYELRVVEDPARAVIDEIVALLGS